MLKNLRFLTSKWQKCIKFVPFAISKPLKLAANELLAVFFVFMIIIVKKNMLKKGYEIWPIKKYPRCGVPKSG